MKTNKFHLLAATAVSVMTATGAQAATPVAYAPATIDGNGASSIIVVLNKTERCLGAKTAIGFTDNTTVAYPDHIYSPASPTASNPAWNCGTQDIQPDLTYRYTSTGSGGGKTDWSLFNISKITPSNPLGFSGHIQYAFSDSAISSTDLANYQSPASTSPVSNGTGPAIQVPFYVLPIALAYAPVYGKTDIGGTPTPLSFNVKSTFVTKDGAGNVTGGLRLKKTTYCKILNGTITNWKDAALTADNGGLSLKDPNDPTDWSATGPGLPIKLVGRFDNSGTTNLTSRHLAAVCPGTDFSAQGGGADQLPSARKANSSATTPDYDQNSGALLGTEVAGKFGLVKGSDGIAAVVGQAIPDPAAGSGATNLGGYFGYVGADYVRPASAGLTVPALYSAALQVGTSTAFAGPTPANATAAFGTTYLPPQSTTAGKYTTTPPAGSVGNRNDPLAWVLPTNATTGLANPTKGYPITGTTNALLYTCYSTPAKRSAIVALAAFQFGFFKTSKTGTVFPAALVNSTAKDATGLQIGILSANGISNLPAAWKTAIYETFFTKTTTGNNPSSLNLWIQDKLPTTQYGANGVTVSSTNSADARLSNPACVAGTGA